MHVPDYVSFLIILLPFALVHFALAQTPAAHGEREPTAVLEPAAILANPSPTSPGDDLADAQAGAIQPTASGEIGINPVDLPPVSHAPIGVDTQYLTGEGDSTKWIGVDEWFSGSATIGAGQPDATGHAIPKGFQVTVATDGSVEIGLSQWVHDRFEAIADGLPACPAKRRRQAVMTCTRRRIYQFAEEIARDSDLMAQVEGLSSELVEAVGGEGYAARLIEGGQTLTFGGADLVGEVLHGLGTIPGLSSTSPLATGVFGSIVLVAVSFNKALEPGDKMGPMAWKFGVAKPEAIPLPKPKDDDEKERCAREDEIQPPCLAKECEGKEDGDTSKCTIGKHKDCPCVWPGKQYSQPFYEEWETIEKIFNSVSTQLSVECDPQSDATELPEALFRGGIYDKFCEEVEKNKDNGVTWVVDHEGNQIPIKARRGGPDESWLPGTISPRSPPVKADDYKGYIIELKWEPTIDGGACPESCNKALLRVSNSQCGHAGAHQNTMAGESKYNLLCGQYTITVKALENLPPPAYRTEPAPSQPTLKDGCWDRIEFGDHSCFAA